MSDNSSWGIVGDLEKSFTPDNNILPQSRELVGKECVGQIHN